MYVFQKHYTVRLLLIQHVVDDEDKDTVNDGCLLLAIGAAIGAAALLILTIIVATAVCIYHRQPSFTNKRVSPCYTVLFCPQNLFISYYRIFYQSSFSAVTVVINACLHFSITWSPFSLTFQIILCDRSDATEKFIHVVRKPVIYILSLIHI